MRLSWTLVSGCDTKSVVVSCPNTASPDLASLEIVLTMYKPIIMHI